MEGLLLYILSVNGISYRTERAAFYDDSGVQEYFHTYFDSGTLHGHFGQLERVVHRKYGVEVPELET